MTSSPPAPEAMSAYERRRWEELLEYWEGKAQGRRQLLPSRTKLAIEGAARATKDGVSRVARGVVDRTPDTVKQAAGGAVDGVLAPTVDHVVHLLELVNEWVVELHDPSAVLDHHRGAGREVGDLADLRFLDLEVLDEVTDGMALRWRTLGAVQGAGFGALAMIPVPVLGSAVAIGLDMIAMQVLTTAIAARTCFAYGYDPTSPEMVSMIERMVARAYRNQALKARSVRQASTAFDAARGRVNWSSKLREDHRLMAAVEKLLQRVGDGSRVSVKNARMGMPFISVVTGAATNSYVLGDTAKLAGKYGATVLLAEKYGLELPQNLRDDDGGEPGECAGEE